MIYIRFCFPAGRFHATPWGSHVNEGEVEWPPSPWRLFRALLSVGFTHLRWTVVPDPVELLVHKMSGCHPAYALPDGIPVHTRHYMPVHEGSKVKSAKILDTSIRLVEGQSLWMRFDVQLTDEERLLLASLVSHLSFLGRAESWVDAELCDSCEDGLDWVTANPSAPATINTRLVRVLSTQRNNDYRRWRDRAIDQAAQTQAASKGKPKLTTAQRRKLEESFPSSLTDCLLTATSTLQAAGWSQPPGSQWIDYLVAQPTRVEIPSKRTSAIYSKRVAAALLSFCSDSVRGRTLPDKSVTVFIGEHLHKACMSKFINLPSHESELATFTGRDCGGDLIEGHRHAHFIPLCIRGDGRYIDHAIVFARDGFGPVAQQSIASVDAIYSAGLPKTHVTLVGFGDLDQVDMEIRAISNGRYKLWTPSRRFRSVTPYVASRHLKLKHDKYTLEANLADECRFRKLPTARITQTPVRNQGRFRIARIGAGRQPPQAEGFQLEIEFDEPLPVNQLPLVLGYGSHFGLGLFEPRHG